MICRNKTKNQKQRTPIPILFIECPVILVLYANILNQTGIIKIKKKWEEKRSEQWLINIFLLQRFNVYSDCALNVHNSTSNWKLNTTEQDGKKVYWFLATTESFTLNDRRQKQKHRNINYINIKNCVNFCARVCVCVRERVSSQKHYVIVVVLYNSDLWLTQNISSIQQQKQQQQQLDKKEQIKYTDRFHTQYEASIE